MHPCRNTWCSGQAKQEGHLCAECWRSEALAEAAQQSANARTKRNRKKETTH